MKLLSVEIFKLVEGFVRVTAFNRKSGECEPTVPRNIGGVPDSGIFGVEWFRLSSESSKK